MATAALYTALEVIMILALRKICKRLRPLTARFISSAKHAHVYHTNMWTYLYISCAQPRIHSRAHMSRTSSNANIPEHMQNTDTARY